MQRCLAAVCLVAVSAATTRAQDAPARACTIRESSRTPLAVDGNREMYVEPTAVLPSRGDVFFAGTPNYVWAPGGPGDARDFVQDSVFGAILGPDGRARLIAGPIDPTRIAGIRGVALPVDGWAFIFAELKSPSRPPAIDTVVRYWHAIHDGRSWTRLESLPAPPSGQLITAGASNLLLRGDTAYFAAMVLEAGVNERVALYERRRGVWTVSMPPGIRGSYIRLVDADSAGFQLAVVRPDRTLSYDSNSLFLYTGPPAWGSSRKIIQGHPEPVHDPAFTKAPGGHVLTWWAQSGSRRIARARMPSSGEQGSVITLDSAVNRVVYVGSLRGGPLWALEHIDPTTGTEIRVLGLDADGNAVILQRQQNPYTGWFGAAASGPDELIISGPLLRSSGPNPSLVTLFIRVRVECAPRAP